MRQKEWWTKGTKRNFITVDCTNDFVYINIYNDKIVLEDYSWERLPNREGTEAFLNMYVSDTLKKKIIKWIYPEEEK